MEYTSRRVCQQCKQVDTFPLTKVEAAFELYDSKVLRQRPCSNCGSIKCESTGHMLPIIDKELLDIWGTDPSLFFSPQDQDVILAEIDYLPMLLRAIDESNYIGFKIEILIEAICVLLCDYTASPSEYTEEEQSSREIIASTIRPELIKRRSLIEAIGNDIVPYIRTVVFPQIGL